MRERRRLGLVIAGAAPLGALLAMAAVGQAPATRPKPPNPAEVRRLDSKLEELRDSFLRDTAALITSYEKIGQFERAKVLLEALSKLDPANGALKARIGELEDRILDTAEVEFVLDPELTWQPVGAVRRDQPLRIRVRGEYKLSVSATVGPAGVPTTNIAEDLVPGIPLGAVMGVIVPPGTAAQPQQGKQNDRQPKPFLVGEDFEKPAERDGILYLRTNLLPGTKCVGHPKVLVSGPQREK